MCSSQPLLRAGELLQRQAALLELLAGQSYWRSGILQLSECLSIVNPDHGFDGLGGGPFVAAVVGGVAGAVAAAGALPGDGDSDVNSEHSSKKSCGEFGGELEQCRRAGLARA